MFVLLARDPHAPELVRQWADRRAASGETHEKVQVPNCDLALAHGTGGALGHRHGSATLIMERE